jgi:hypothetical protein
LFASLVADGRPQLGGLPITTVAGQMSGQVTRIRSLTVAGEAVSNAATLSIGDSLIGNLATEVGHPVDGLLGGTFLREFLVTVDFPRGSLHLQRYATRAHIVDEFQRVGVALGYSAGMHRYGVSAVYAGTDAALKQLQVGDEIVAVGGQPLDGLDLFTAERLLEGTVGDTRQLMLGHASQLASGATITVRIDDLVPAPR